VRDLKRFEEPRHGAYRVLFEPPSLDSRIVNQYAALTALLRADLTTEAWLGSRPLPVRQKIVIPRHLKATVRERLAMQTPSSCIHSIRHNWSRRLRARASIPGIQVRSNTNQTARPRVSSPYNVSMSRPALLLLAAPFFLRAETHPMTLRQAAEAAMKQSPDVVLAHLDEDKARAGIRVARQPFVPRVVVGSGLAYSDGFPMSVEGSAPSVMQANAIATIFNRPQSFQVAQAKEDARGAAIAVTARRDQVTYRVTALYLEAERAARLGSLARKAVESQQTVLDSVRTQVAEGRALPLAEKQAALALARASQAAESLDDAQAAAETSLAIALGFSAGDRVHPIERDRPLPALPASQEQAIQSALDSNPELRRIESQLMSKQLERRGQKAARLPRMDLVAQYGMLAQFNNYAEFFQRFQRNNIELGVSFQVPVFSSTGGQISQTDADLNRLRVEISSARNRIAADIQQSFREARKAETAATVARLDLEVARAQLDVVLAQLQEGRAPLRQVEEARLLENDKWMAFHDAQFTVEKARWNVLLATGTLLPAIAALPAE